jgi:hypothetical protein
VKEQNAMRAVLIATIAAVGLASACGDSNPTGPDTGGGQNTTTTTTFNMNLSPANERPAVTNAEASASGTATIVLRVTRDPNNTIVGATADFSVNMQGFPAGSTITMAHIHPGNATTTGTIIVNTGLTSGEVTLTNGAGSFTKNNVTISDLSVAQNILNGPGNFYFNVHSAMNAPGVLRAQLDGSGAPNDPGPKPPANPDDPYYPPTPGSAN